MHGYACRSEDMPANVFGEEPDISHQNTSDYKNQVRFLDDVQNENMKQGMFVKSRYSDNSKNTYNDIGSRNYVNVRS